MSITQGVTSVGEEIQQRRPFHSREQEAVIALWRTADQVRNRFVRMVEPYGITLQQYNVLRILRGAEPDGLPTLAIAERMIERTPGITRMIDRLLKKGLVTRGPLPGDRRCVICRITPKGLELLARMDEPVNAEDQAALAILEGDELDRLLDMLDRVRAAQA